MQFQGSGTSSLSFSHMRLNISGCLRCRYPIAPGRWTLRFSCKLFVLWQYFHTALFSHDPWARSNGGTVGIDHKPTAVGQEVATNRFRLCHCLSSCTCFFSRRRYPPFQAILRGHVLILPRFILLTLLGMGSGYCIHWPEKFYNKSFTALPYLLHRTISELEWDVIIVDLDNRPPQEVLWLD